MTEEDIRKAFELTPDEIIHQALMDFRNQLASLETCERLFLKKKNEQTILTMKHCLSRVEEIAERARKDISDWEWSETEK